MSKLRRQYERVYRSLNRVELQQGMRRLDELDLGEIFDHDSDLWLGFYTQEGIEIALERYGLLDDIRDQGFKKLALEVRVDDPDEHMLRIWSELPQCPEPLLELVVSRDVLHFDEELSQEIGADFAPVLTVQWLLMQNPMATFEDGRLPLPGQTRPGLGVGEQVMEILRNACRRLKLCGLMTIPAHFHNAAMYGVNYRYLNADSEGTFRALERDVLSQAHSSLASAGWAVEWQMVVDRQNRHTEAFEWFHEAMVYAIDTPFTTYFDSVDYQEQVDGHRGAHEFEVFSDALRRNMASRGLEPWDQALVDTWLEENAP